MRKARRTARPVGGLIMFEPPSGALYRYEWEVTPEGDLRRVSGSADLLHLLGYEHEELAASGGWMKLLTEDHEDRAREIARRLTAGEAWSGRFPLKTKDGDTLVLEIHNEIERRPDGSLLIHGIARDVTNEESLERVLREAETRLRLLTESIPVVLWSTDQELRFTWSAGSGLAAVGLGENEVLGMDLFEFFQVVDPDFVPIAAHRRALHGESVAFELVWRDRHFRCSVEPASDARGDVTQTIGVAVDVTDEAHLHDEAQEVGREVARLSLAAVASQVEQAGSTVIDLDDMQVDLRSQTVTKGSDEVDLTRTEFKLLVELASHAGNPVPRDDLLRAVWGYDFGEGSSPLWMTIRRLREKIEDDPHDPHRILTVRGVGYRLTAN